MFSAFASLFNKTFHGPTNKTQKNSIRPPSDQSVFSKPLAISRTIRPFISHARMGMACLAALSWELFDQSLLINHSLHVPS